MLAAEASGRDVVRVGVSFRIDGTGSAHRTHDMAAIEAAGRVYTEKRVKAVPLPRGASGSATPKREAKWDDLDDIDLIYIPGAPSANSTQISTSSGLASKVDITEAEKDIAKTEEGTLKAERRIKTLRNEIKKLTKEIAKAKEGASEATDVSAKEKRVADLEAEIAGSIETVSGERAGITEARKHLSTVKEEQEFSPATKDFAKVEHESRAGYELRLIAMARTRGIPVLAICAGSWRLLEAYGGKVRTLPKGAQRGVHKAEHGDPWALRHGVKITAESMLNRMTGAVDLPDTNSTHWAVAVDRSGGPERTLDKVAGGEDPSAMMRIVARTSGEAEDTVEGFETRRGVPHIGVQWHPESNLPGMLGHVDAEGASEKAAAGLFRGMLGAAVTSRARRRVVQQLNRDFFGKRLNRALGSRTDDSGSEIYDVIARELGRPPKEADIRSYLARLGVQDF